MKRMLSLLLSAIMVGQLCTFAAPMKVTAVETAAEAATDGSGSTVSLFSESSIFTGNEWTGRDVTDTDGNTVRNVHVFAINKEQSRADSIAYQSEETAYEGAQSYNKSLSDYYKKLSDTEWSFKYYDSPSQANEDSSVFGFYKEDYDSSSWNTIPVPSTWQTQINPATGEYYGTTAGQTDLFNSFKNTTVLWRNYKGNPEGEAPFAPTAYNPTGLYRYEFTVDKAWEGRRVYIDFEGVGSAMYLWINGHEVGYSEDSYSQKEFDITDYVHFDKPNVLAMQVIRWSDGSWLESIDTIRLNGITRDVYLHSTPMVRLRDFEVITDFDESYEDATLGFTGYVKNYTSEQAENVSIELKLYDPDGELLEEYTSHTDTGSIAAGKETALSLDIPVSSPLVWTAETPYLYTLTIALKQDDEVLSNEAYLVGFREITYRVSLQDGTYGNYDDFNRHKGENGVDWDYDNIRLNGNYIYIKGVNRHDTYPEAVLTAYDGTYAQLEEDIRLMKENNINSVRLSHYQQNPYIHYLCNKYGIYVMAEASLEGSNLDGAEITVDFGEAIIDRQNSLIYRERNQPCVVIWSLGNETYLGNGADMKPEDEYFPGILYHLGDYVHELEPSRPVHYEPPFAAVGVAIDPTIPTKGALTQENLLALIEQYPELDIDPFYSVDMKSNMYPNSETMEEYAQSGVRTPYIMNEMLHGTGNSHGGMKNFWDIIRSSPNMQGAYYWDFIDTAVYLTDENEERYLSNETDFGIGHTAGSTDSAADGFFMADRTPKPSVQELKRVMGNLQFELVSQDIDSGRVTVKLINENMVTNANEYEITWTLFENNTETDSGTVSADVAPDALDGTNSANITIEFDAFTPEKGKEYYINICAEKEMFYSGSVPMTEQCTYQVVLDTGYERTEASSASDFDELSVEDGDEEINIFTDGFSAVIDKTTGLLSSYEIDGTQMLTSPLTPNYHRPLNNNDRGDNVFKNDPLCLINIGSAEKSFDDNGVLKAVSVRADFKYTNSGTKLSIMYTVTGDKAVKLDFSTIVFNVYDGRAIPKIGTTLNLNGALEKVSYFGMGPEENYQDRMTGASLGFYTNTVDGMFTKYDRPVDNGNRMDVRYAALTGDGVPGILFTGEGNYLQIAASHYEDEAIDGVFHLKDCEKTEDTVFKVDYLSNGIGALSFAWQMFDEHHLPNGEYRWSYSIRPLKENANAREIIASANTKASAVTDVNTFEAAEKLKDYKAYMENEKGYTQSTFADLEEAYCKAYNALYGTNADEKTSLAKYFDELEDAVSSLEENSGIDTQVLEELISEASSKGFASYAQFCRSKLEECNQSSANMLVKYLEYVLAGGENPEIQTAEYYLDKTNIFAEDEYKSEGYVKMRIARNALMSVLEGGTSEEIAQKTYELASCFVLLESSIEKLTGGLIGSASKAGEYEKMFDGNLSTYTKDSANGTAYGGYDLGKDKSATLKYFKYYPRYCDPVDYPNSPLKNIKLANRNSVGDVVQGSVDGINWVTIATLYSPATKPEWHILKSDDTTPYRYFRVFWTYSMKWFYTDGSICEAEFYGVFKDTSYLEDCLNTAIKLDGMGVEGYEEYIDKARSVINSSSDYTQNEINDICIEFTSISSSTGEGTVQLIQAIDDFDSLDIRDYSTESYFEAYGVYSEAKAVLAGKDKTEEEKALAAQALEEAIKALLPASKIKVTGTVIGEDSEIGAVHSSCSSYSYTKVMSVTDIPTSVTGNRACLFGTLYGGFDFGENTAYVIKQIDFSCLANYLNIGKSYVGLTFEGSNDGKKWNTLATVNENIPTSTTNIATVTYTVSDDTPYRYVRFNTSNSYGRVNSSQSDLDGKILGVFFYTEEPGNKTLLQQAIDEAEAYLEKDSIFVASLQKKIDAAKTLLSKSVLTVSDVNNAIFEMRSIMNGIDSEQQTDIGQRANAVDQNLYTSESYFAFKAAYEKAQEQGTEKALKELDYAIDSLVELQTSAMTSDTVISEKAASDIAAHNIDECIRSAWNDPTKLLGSGKTTDATSLTYRLCLRCLDSAGYDFGEGNARIITRVSLGYQSTYQNLISGLRGLTFEGSNDGESWDVLYTIPSDFKGKISSVITSVSVDEFTFTNTKAYRYIRINAKNTVQKTSNEADPSRLLSIVFYGIENDTSLLEETLQNARLINSKTPSRFLDSAIASAAATLSAYNSQTQINDAVIYLENAISATQNYADLIDKANSLLAVDYTLDSWKAFEQAYDKAVATSSDEDINALKAVIDNMQTINSSGEKLIGKEFTQGSFHVAADFSQSWNGGESTDRVFMYFDNTQEVYVGYEFKKRVVVNTAVIYPDPNLTGKANGAAFRRLFGSTVEGSVDGESWTVLGTIGAEHQSIVADAENPAICFEINDDTGYKYLRFCAKPESFTQSDGYFTFSEVLFYGSEYEDKSIKLDGGKIFETERNNEYKNDWSDGKYSARSTTDRVFIYNIIDNEKVDAYAGIDFGYNLVIPTKVVIVPQQTVNSDNSYHRLRGSVLQGRNSDGEWVTIEEFDFDKYKEGLYSGYTDKIELELSEYSPEKYSALRLFRSKDRAYVEYLGFVELEFYGEFYSTAEKLSGTPIYSHSDATTHYVGKPSLVFDGNPTTGFMVNTAALDGTKDIWTGYDFGEEGSAIITQVKYYGLDRDHTASRVKGQIFQGSNDLEVWTDLATITEGTQGVYTSLAVGDTNSYRYVRLYDKGGASDSFFCQSEVEFYGYYINRVSFTYADGTEHYVEYMSGKSITLPEITEEMAGNSDLSHVMWTDGVYNYEGAQEVEYTQGKAYRIVTAPKSYNEASLKYAGDNTGIRFKTSVSARLEQESAAAGYIVALKTAIEPENLTFEYCAANNIQYVTANSMEKNEDGQYIKSTVYDVALNGDIFYTARLIGLDASNKLQMETPVIVRPFVTDKNGDYIYGNPMCNSIANVAEQVYTGDDFEALDEELKSYIILVLTTIGYSF